MQNLQKLIEESWKTQSFCAPKLKKAVDEIIKLLESGKLKIAEKIDRTWQINAWVKKAVLIYMKISDAKQISGGPDQSFWFDKIDQKFKSWSQAEFLQNQIRAVPGCFVRQSAFIGKNVVLMPCFINVGAYIGSNTMIDTWSTIGSCAHIGKNCHVSGGVGIGGVLEPITAKPVIIEDDCFIGARSEIAEGVIVSQGSVIGMGCYIGASTKIVDKSTGKISYGYVPPYSVVVPGSLKCNENLSINCALIVKKVDQKTREKVKINDLLRFEN